MPAGIATLVYKDSAATNRNFSTWSSTGDLTGSFTAMTALHDGAGALISPATSGLQVTGNAALASILAALGGALTVTTGGLTAAQLAAAALATAAGQASGNTSLTAIAAALADSAAITTGALADHLVVKASPGKLAAVDASATTADGWIMLFNLTAAPADGAVAPLKAWQLPAGATERWTFTPRLAMGTGIVLVFSATGPYVKTASATALLSGDFL